MNVLYFSFLHLFSIQVTLVIKHSVVHKHRCYNSLSDFIQAQAWSPCSCHLHTTAVHGWPALATHKTQSRQRKQVKGH